MRTGPLPEPRGRCEHDGCGADAVRWVALFDSSLVTSLRGYCSDHRPFPENPEWSDLDWLDREEAVAWEVMRS